ncbi:MAG TPA: hypothetical protein VNG33_11020, partial [Polyangiaceae bacterium]|nr:hypothetical protein [Polyangiaceae bacterium]
MRPALSLRLKSALPLLLLAACSSQTPSSQSGAPGAGGSAAGAAGNAGAAGQVSTAGTSAVIPTAGTAGATSSAGASGSPTMGGANSTGGTAGSSSSGAAGVSSAGSAGSDGQAGDTDPPAPRPINVMAGTGCNCNVNTPGGKLQVDTRKPIQGKLVITLPGICGGPGGGGLEGTVMALGFHVFQPRTQSCVNSAPDKYKQMIQANPLDPEANRQVGDARMELWDGVDRVDWVTVAKGDSIAEETLAAIKAGVTQDPGGDWGYYLNADGSVRWSDVFIMGYSWGAQSAAMIASYVRFGRVFCASGPQAEQFPNA